ncbi:MAG: adenosylcobinamide-GDP ribazoletransferase [Desulforhopalus sp.]|jgi:adenosylcobinamide-GDP ribazoletransferase
MKENRDPWMKEKLAAFLAALRFLTIVPIEWNAERDGDYFKQSLLFFPVIGLLIGSVGYLLTLFSLWIFPQPVVTCLVICYLAFISGCLHLDGLSDSGDGLLSSRPRDRSMEIMKDSRVGAMGVIVTVLVILAKFSALISIDPHQLAITVFFMPLAGRVIILCTMAALPYARQEGGIGGLFYSKSVKRLAFCSLFVLIAFLVLLTPGKLFIVLSVVVLVFYLFNRWCKSKIGGATGDTLGANCELAEMAVALAFSASFSLCL